MILTEEQLEERKDMSDRLFDRWCRLCCWVNECTKYKRFATGSAINAFVFTEGNVKSIYCNNYKLKRGLLKGVVKGHE